MKIAVVGYPRTGSTKLCYAAEQLFPTRYVGEVLTRTTNASETVKFINSQPNILVKLFSYQLTVNEMLMYKIDWAQFDLVCFTYRDSIVEAFISTMIANSRRQWIRGIDVFNEDDAFTVDINKFDEYYTYHIAPFADLMKTVCAANSNTISFSYDEIADTKCLLTKLGHANRTLVLPIEPTGINYKEKCLNYNEVVQAAATLIG